MGPGHSMLEGLRPFSLEKGLIYDGMDLKIAVCL